MSHSAFELQSRMKRRMIISGFTPEGILKNILLFSFLQLPANLASRSFIFESNSSSDDCATPDNTANWILYFLSECHTNTELPLIVAGNLTGKITRKIHYTANTTLVLFTESKTNFDRAYARAKWTKDFHEDYYYRYEYKAKIFVVAASTESSLNHVIKQLKLSRWWNFSGLFLILDEEPEKSSCRNAQSYLSTAWSSGLLSAVYLCLQNSTQNLALYSYNPFEDQAPRPEWQTVASYGIGRNGHPWTLFRLEMDKFAGEFTCGDIFFEKIRNLYGYQVRINAVNLPPTLIIETERNISGLDKYTGEDGWLAKTVWGMLNATIIEVPHNQTGNQAMGYTDEHGVEHGMKADVKNGKVDMSLNHRYFSMSKNLGTTYPHILTTFCFLTKSQGTLPLWKDLIQSINPLLGFLMLGIILTLILLLTILEDKEHIGMLFAIVRILVCAPMVKLPTKFTARFLVAGALLLFGIMYGIFGVQISAIVTKPKTYKDIDTLEELEASGYEIYGHAAFKNMIAKSPVLRDRFVASELDKHCFEIAMGNAPVACASDCLRLLVESKKENQWHVAREPIASNYANFISGIGWPILDRVNQLITRMVAAGLPEYWREQTLWRMAIGNVAALSNTQSSNGPLSIKFHDLDAVLYALLIGLTFATLIFFFELAFFRW